MGDAFSKAVGEGRGSGAADEPEPRSYSYTHARVTVEECAEYLTALELPPADIISVTPVVSGGAAGAGNSVRALDVIHVARPSAEQRWADEEPVRKERREQEELARAQAWAGNAGMTALAALKSR